MTQLKPLTLNKTEARLTVHFYTVIDPAENRARRYGADIMPVKPQDLAKKVLDRKGQCAYCDNKLKWDGMTLDHVIPLSSGYKEHSTRNLVVCCKPCNSSKRDKPVFEWLKDCDRTSPEWLDKLSGQNWFETAYHESEHYHPVYGDSKLIDTLCSISFFTRDQRLQLQSKIITKKLNRQERIELIKMFEQFRAFTAV